MGGILAFLVKNWKPIMVALLLVGIYNAGDYRGAHRVKRDWKAADAKRKIADDQALLTAQGNVITKERENVKITSEVSNGYESQITAIDNAYSGILDGLHTSGTGDTSIDIAKLPNASGGHNAAACSNGLSKPDKAFLVKSARNAELQTARLLALQSWVTRQQHAH